VYRAIIAEQQKAGSKYRC